MSIKPTQSYMLQFSWCKMPDEVSIFTENGETDADAYADIGIKLASNRPMLSIVFNNDSDSPPSLKTMHKIMQSEYVNSSDDPDAHETYGLLLDTLRRLQMNADELGKMLEKEKVENAAAYTARPLVLTLNVGALIADKETACMLHLSPITSFSI